MNEPSPWIPVFLTILFGGGSFVYVRVRHFRELLPDPEYRRVKVEALRDPGLWRLYLRGLGGSLDWLQRHFGHPLGARALGVCLTIGLLYGVVFLLLAWGLGAPATLQSTRILPDVAQPWRVVWSVGGLVWLTAVVWIAICTPQIDLGALGWIWRGFAADPQGTRVRLVFGVIIGLAVLALLLEAPSLLIWQPEEGGMIHSYFRLDTALFWSLFSSLVVSVSRPGATVRVGILFILVAIAMAVVGTVTSAAAVSFAVFLIAVTCTQAAGIFDSDESNISTGAGAKIFTAAIAAVLAFVVAKNWGLIDVTSELPFMLGVSLFYIILPAVNSVWDWLSWWVSRRLGQALHDLLTARRNVAAMVLLALGHVVLDLVAALAFLALLALTLPLVIDGFNAVVAPWVNEPLPLPLAGFLCVSAQAPLGAGLWATLLLFSTLVPTALHLMAVIASPVAAAATRLPGVWALAEAMMADNPSVMTLTRAAWVLALWRPLAYLAGLAVTLAIGWGLFRSIGLLTQPVPEILLALALRDHDLAAGCLATVSGGLTS